MNEQLNELVQFFRDEGHFMGHQGDEEGWTPEHTAVLAMRKLMLYEKYPVLSGRVQKSLEAYSEQKDAARYQWLRSEAADDFFETYDAQAMPIGTALDREIDKEMSNKE